MITYRRLRTARLRGTARLMTRTDHGLPGVLAIAVIGVVLWHATAGRWTDALYETVILGMWLSVWVSRYDLACAEALIDHLLADRPRGQRP